MVLVIPETRSYHYFSITVPFNFYPNISSLSSNFLFPSPLDIFQNFNFKVTFMVSDIAILEKKQAQGRKFFDDLSTGW